jgi:hypothetical protein
MKVAENFTRFGLHGCVAEDGSCFEQKKLSCFSNLDAVFLTTYEEKKTVLPECVRIWETDGMKPSSNPPLRHEDRKVLKLIQRIQQQKVKLSSLELKRAGAA